MYNEDKKKRAEEFLKAIDSLKNIQGNFDNSFSPFVSDYLNGYFDAIKTEHEVSWSKSHEHTSLYNDFSAQLTYVAYSESGLKGGEEVQLKMRFSYAVTLMESCLSEMLKSVTMRYEQFKRNAVSKIPELNNSPLKLLDLFDKSPKEIIDNKIMGYLSYILYHNLKKVKNVYEQILGKDISARNDELFKKISEFTEVRHDIVHRNGKKATGELINVTPEMVDSCIANIMRFVDGVHDCINEAIEELHAKK